MASRVIPVTDLDKAGVIMDTPSVTLPPNVFSNVENVRFRDGAVRKMEGEIDILTHPDLVYAAYWQGPFHNFYVLVEGDGDIILQEEDGTQTPVGSIGIGTGARYQHTLFNGGHNFILNNGVSTPVYLSDTELVSTMTAAELPNWDSYLAQENVVSVVWDQANFDIPLGREVSLDQVTGAVVDSVGTQRIIYRVIPRDPSLPVIISQVGQLTRLDDTGTYAVPSNAPFSIRFVTDNWMITPRERDTSVTPAITGAEAGDTIEIAIQERPDLIVTAGVVRAYGNLLVAGNLREVAGGRVIRNIPGTIRTSDVAPPGNVPANWNPFRNGANTADEFTLSSTGRVQDMVELQGNLYIYTTNSIHSLQQTGGNIPFGVRPVTDNYGANNTGSVLEVDGKHIVVGSDDIYVFGGHPGSIQSIADGRVRHQPLFDRDDIRILRYNRYDELWFYSPGMQDMFIWNYRDNTWTRRSQSTPLLGSQGLHIPIFVNIAGGVGDRGNAVYRPANDNDTTGVTNYLSFVERKRLAITPEFTTETLISVGILSEGEASFSIAAVGTVRPAQVRVLPTDDDNPTPFISQMNYKADIRAHGRLLNYRITDTTEVPWSIAGIQFDIGTGGTR